MIFDVAKLWGVPDLHGFGGGGEEREEHGVESVEIEDTNATHTAGCSS
jgi:hypothetical protein